MNTVRYGENLKILEHYTKDQAVDLTYLGQPLNSNSNYNVLFKDKSGTKGDSHIRSFERVWQDF